MKLQRLLVSAVALVFSSCPALCSLPNNDFQASDQRPAALSVGFWDIQRRKATEGLVAQPDKLIPTVSVESTRPSVPKYPAHYFKQQISHFDNQERGTFLQRYWFDSSFYKPGGPVIVLDAGEGSGELRLPILESGILNILCRATGGIGIVFENRYYGKSFPFDNLSTKSLRYLTTQESLEDGAHFAKTLVLDGQENLKITAPTTPWIYYGGSYAGAKAAFMIHLYPALIWGALASSAPVRAQVTYWEYYEPIRQHAPPRCILPLIETTKSIDQVLSSGNRRLIDSLKKVFWLGDLTDDRDFVNILSSPVYTWQRRNWDPEVGSETFDHFCDSLSASKLNVSTDTTGQLDFLKSTNFNVSIPMGYIEFMRKYISSQCPPDKSQNECFGTNDLSSLRKEGLDATWRPWTWQMCTEWGLFQNAPPDESHPRLISKYIDLDYSSKACRLAFGESVPKLPDVSKVNRYGEFSLNHPRLAFIDGDQDPWLYLTVHSPLNNARSSLKKLLWLIKGGVHHWDENGLSHNDNFTGAREPVEIKKVHLQQIQWVKNWLQAFHNGK